MSWQRRTGLNVCNKILYVWFQAGKGSFNLIFYAKPLCRESPIYIQLLAQCAIGVIQKWAFLHQWCWPFLGSTFSEGRVLLAKRLLGTDAKGRPVGYALRSNRKYWCQPPLKTFYFPIKGAILLGSPWNSQFVQEFWKPILKFWPIGTTHHYLRINTFQILPIDAGDARRNRGRCYIFSGPTLVSNITGKRFVKLSKSLRTIMLR